ncbi:hypothetical protein [Thermoleophilum album]|nr:hypothetical protein [Thermoleophilum album]
MPTDTDDSVGRDRATAADLSSYVLVVASLYIGFGFLWYYSAKEKLFDQDGEMPPPLKERFDGSFLDTVPGLDTAWLLLGIVEAVVFLVVVASLLAGEFLPHRRKPLLLNFLALSMLTFAGMLFAESMVGEFESVFQLFTYLAGTALLIVLVLLMPPYRDRRWLASLSLR